MRRERLIVVGPLPPPTHGVTVSTSLVLANKVLREHFEVGHLDTSDHRSGRNVGTWDLVNSFAALRAILRLLVRARGRKGLVYLPLSQSTPGFLRDSLLVLVASVWRWRIAAHLRGSDFRSYYKGSPVFLRRWIRFVVRRVDSIAIMGASLEWVIGDLVRAGAIAVVPNGTPEPEPVDVPRDPHHVLFLSNLRRRKGVVQAGEAAVLVLEQFPRARFTFAGSWESAELEAELRRLAGPFDGTIDFRPAVHGKEKAELLASAAILLFPPVEPEGHPRVVLEALAAGLPVVTTDRGAIRETVVDGESGYILRDPEPSLLADRLLRLLRDPLLLQQFSEAARQRHLDHFTQERADHVLVDWLEQVSSAGLPAARGSGR